MRPEPARGGVFAQVQPSHLRDHHGDEGRNGDTDHRGPFDTSRFGDQRSRVDTMQGRYSSGSRGDSHKDFPYLDIDEHRGHKHTDRIIRDRHVKPREDRSRASCYANSPYDRKHNKYWREKKSDRSREHHKHPLNVVRVNNERLAPYEQTANSTARLDIED
ncbi:unnamed protein product [Eruca vesicaria subsp. sativa]|uniref:Uncharacterized protein n=1 Tax=Eruca vesicaria subsp. sativa TaxID=29727 RepID=A0ABC8LLD6_ERUVS|nr:unnamed protein product [Eruca vesicaria subsp. sativa]